MGWRPGPPVMSSRVVPGWPLRIRDEQGWQGSSPSLLPLAREALLQLTGPGKTPGEERALDSEPRTCPWVQLLHHALQNSDPSLGASLGHHGEDTWLTVTSWGGWKKGQPPSSVLLPSPKFQTLDLPFGMFIHSFIHSVDIYELLLGQAQCQAHQQDRTYPDS